MNTVEFIAKWRKAELAERSASQQHFLDLCELVGHPKPAEADPTGEWFTFEKGASKHGGEGWSDVWKRGFFVFECKSKKNVEKAYDQLLLYRSDLGNPPLLVGDPDTTPDLIGEVHGRAMVAMAREVNPLFQFSAEVCLCCSGA